MKKKKDDAYPLRFNGEKEKSLYKKYKHAADDLECSVRELIIEAMINYEKLWKGGKNV